MTYECAAYFKLLLLCGYKDELETYIDLALEEQDPLSDVVLKLSTAGTDDKKMLSVLNEYLLQVNDSDIDYNGSVFDLVMSFLKRKYVEDSMSMADITRLMYQIAYYSDRYFDEPWSTMYYMGDFFDESENGFVDKEDYKRKFDAFINDKVCLHISSPCQPKESYIKRMFPKNALLLAFLFAEAILYALILTTGGTVLTVCCFSAIVICFLYALTNFKTGSKLIIAALACTVCADFCLVVCSPIQQLWGMIFFLGAQSLYALHLHRTCTHKWVLPVRLVLTAAAIAVTCIVLKEKTDALALVSLCYYANLVMNILTAFLQFKRYPLLSVGFVLFLLCDTVIGLQAACGVYLPISTDSLIYKIIFMDFFLSWFFYLPSQVLIALSSRKSDTEKEI